MAEAFFDAWKQRIQSAHTFPLAPAVKEELKKEYISWYLDNLDIVRSGSAASSALANCDPSLAARKKVGGFFFSLCNATRVLLLLLFVRSDILHRLMRLTTARA